MNACKASAAEISAIGRSRAEQLARIRQPATLWELAVIREAERYLIDYLPMKGRDQIHRAVHESNVYQRLCALTGEAFLLCGLSRRDGARMGGWSIEFTGRTQAEALRDGELDRIADLPLECGLA